MSGKFDGFSQEDINKLSKGTKTAKTSLSGRGIRRVPDVKTSKEQKSQVRPPPAIQNMKTSTKCEVLETTTTTDDSLTSFQEVVHFRPLSVKKQSKDEICDESILNLSSCDNESKKYPRKENLSPFRGISLKDFEAQRKRIEEQNKQKKELLYRAIEQHSKKTAEETKKIEDIKSELAKLDNELATDVAILRKQIEAACLHYYQVQKQYDKTESQFLKAKLELHKASEKKELLTEHLCTVIAHNENIKASKLSELMDKVGISSTDNNINLAEN